ATGLGPGYGHRTKDAEDDERHVCLLRMAGQQLQGQRQSAESQECYAPGDGEAVVREQHGGQPRRRADLIQVAYLPYREATEGVRQPGDGRGQWKKPERVPR